MKLFLKNVFRCTGTLMLIMGLWISTYAIAYINRSKEEPLEYGVSFSVLHAKELGIDWREAYPDLLDSMDFKKVRLMSYWNEIEPEQGNFHFDELDWLFDQADTHNVKVSLAVGYRQPRWPECHPPEWIDKTDFRNELDNYLEKVVKRYRAHPALESFQLENEFANRRFGDCSEFPYKKDVFHDEARLIRTHAPNVPILSSASNQGGIPLIDNVADKIGFSVYRVAYLDYGLYDGYWRYWYMPALWHSFRAELAHRWVDAPVFIHELQLEPWGPRPTRDLSVEEQNQSMPVSQISDSLSYARKTGINEIYLWGGEWWYWRKEHLQDPTIWDAVKKELENPVQ